MMNIEFVFGSEFHIFGFSPQHALLNTTCTSRGDLEYSNNNKNYIMILNFGRYLRFASP